MCYHFKSSSNFWINYFYKDVLLFRIYLTSLCLLLLLYVIFQHHFATANRLRINNLEIIFANLLENFEMKFGQTCVGSSSSKIQLFFVILIVFAILQNFHQIAVYIFCSLQINSVKYTPRQIRNAISTSNPEIIQEYLHFPMFIPIYW